MMEIARDSLEIKRKILETFTENGLYPYSKRYLREVKKEYQRYWQNHFSTIGLVGINEAIVNLLGVNIATRDGQDAVWTVRCTTVRGKTTYYCTMHPDVESTKPGICPRCKMALVPKEAATGKAAHLVFVTIGKTDGERTEMLSGLSVGDGDHPRREQIPERRRRRQSGWRHTTC
jgi:hypothetical protein